MKIKLHWGNAIFIYFTIFLTLAAIFIIFSFRQKVELVEKDYYNKGANYTEQIHINSRSEGYQDSIQLKLKDNFIEVTMCESLQQKANAVYIHFFRPSDENLDLKYEIPTNNPSFLISNDEFKTGRYIAKIKWSFANDLYMIEKDLFVN